MLLLQSLINVTILSLLLAFAFQYQIVRNKENADVRYALASYLFERDGDASGYLHQRIETVDELVGTLKHTVRAYYALPTRSRGVFMHYTSAVPGGSDADVIAPPELLLQYHMGYYGTLSYANIATETYQLSPDDPIGPLQNGTALLHGGRAPCVPRTDSVAGRAFIPCRASPIGDSLDRVTQMRLSFSLFARSRQGVGSQATTVSSTWSVVVAYGFTGHKSVIIMNVHLLSVSERLLERWPLLMSWIVGLLALFDMSLRLHMQARGTTAYSRGRSGEQRCASATVDRRAQPHLQSPVWGVLRTQEGGWRWLGYLSDVVACAFCLTAVAAQHMHCTYDTLEETVTLLLAFSALLCSFRLVALLRLFPAWYVLIDGLATALQQLSVLAVGVAPVLLGYGVCGTAVFGGMSGTYFESVPHSMVTLLCSMFGDNLLDTFLRLDQSPHWLQSCFARIFFFTFLALFVCNILNIAHSIIQDSYSQALKSYMSTVATAAGAPAATGLPKAGGVSVEGSGGGPCEKTKGCDAFGGGRRGQRTDGCATEAVTASPSNSATTPLSEDTATPELVPQETFPQARGTLRAAEVERMLRGLERVFP